MIHPTREINQRTLEIGIKMTKFIALVLLSVALLASCSSDPQVEGTQFSANILATQAGDSATGKIYVKDHIYRMDLHQHGHDFIVIVDQDSNLTQLLMPPEKIYMDMPTDDQMSIRNDPFQALKYTSSMGEIKLVATEKINGQFCDKFTVTIDSNQILEYWQHKKLDFPIKMVGTVGPRNTMELSNIAIRTGHEAFPGTGMADKPRFSASYGYAIYSQHDCRRNHPCAIRGWQCTHRHSRQPRQ